MSRRFSVTSVLDVSTLWGYYGRLDCYASFTDTGEYDRTGEIDRNIRPNGVLGYPINDVVGRYSRETTLYARVFRYRDDSSHILNPAQYSMDHYEMDVKKVMKAHPKLEEELDEIYTLVPGQIRIRNAFSHLWQFTYMVAVKLSGGASGVNKKWADVLMDLGYKAVLDKRGTGVMTTNRRPAILVLGQEYDHRRDIIDLEIVSTQKYKKEQNSRIANQIIRFNNLTRVANARNRIKK